MSNAASPQTTGRPAHQVYRRDHRLANIEEPTDGMPLPETAIGKIVR
jgi:hypothetical protein